MCLLLRWEAAQIPDVTVAMLDSNKLNKEQTVYMPKIPDIAKCPKHLAPLKQWEVEFLADFAELRAVCFLTYYLRLSMSALNLFFGEEALWAFN